MTFEGEVVQLDLMEKLVELWREKFTGALRFENDAVIKIIYFKQGNVISASTNDRADSIDEVLVKAGKINKEHVRQALSKRKESETLGDALLGLGFITKKELAWARRVQLVGVVRSILSWTAGNFALVADYLPKREEGTIFYVPQIVLELVVTDQDRDKFLKALDDGNVVLEKSDDFDADYPFLGLNEDADRIVELIDGERSATEIGASSSMDSFNVFKLLLALRQLGLIRNAKAKGAAEVFPEAETAFDFQLDDTPAADTDWSLPAEETVASAEPASAAAAGPTEWSGPTEPEPASDDFTLESASSASPEEWAVPADEDESAVDIPAAAVPVSPARPTPQESFSLKVDPAILASNDAGNGAFNAQSAHPVSAGPLSAETLSTTWPRAQQRSPLAPVAKRRSKAPTIVAAAALAVIALLGAGWFFFVRSVPDPAVVAASPQPAPPAAAPVTETNASASIMPAETPMETPAPTATSLQPSTAVNPSGPQAGAATTARPATPPSDATRAKYEQMATEFARTANPAEFTVQFELVCQTASVTRALREGGSHVWFAPVSFKGQTCFRVFWGHFPSRAAAEAAIGQIPGGLRAGSKAAVVSVAGAAR